MCPSTPGVSGDAMWATGEVPRDLVSKRAPNLCTMPHHLSGQQKGALVGPDQVPGEAQRPRETGVTEPKGGSEEGPSPPFNLH